MSINYRLPKAYDNWILLLVISIIAILLFVQLVSGQVVTAQSTLHEDQALLCLKNTDENSSKFGTEECAVIDWLDLMNDTQTQDINEIFNNDIDTFSVEDWLK